MDDGWGRSAAFRDVSIDQQRQGEHHGAFSDLAELAEEYEITGGSIINVLRYCSIIAAQRGDNKVKENDILIGIKKEFLKEGITL